MRLTSFRDFIQYRYLNVECDLCKQTKTCTLRVDYESHREDSFVLCYDCQYKKLDCVICKKELYEGKLACQIDPREYSLGDKCKECENEEWKARWNNEPKANTEEQSGTDSWNQGW